MHAYSTRAFAGIPIRTGCALAGVFLAVACCGLPGVAMADDSMGGGAARARSGDLEDHEAHSGDVDDMSAESGDPSGRTVGSENLEDHLVAASDPEAKVTGSEDMESHGMGSQDLDDLSEARPDRGFESIGVPGQANWGPTTDPEVLVARKNLVRAQKRAESARAAYGDMMEANYPRGDARIRIVAERDASMSALEEAEQALAAAE